MGWTFSSSITLLKLGCFSCIFFFLVHHQSRTFFICSSQDFLLRFLDVFSYLFILLLSVPESHNAELFFESSMSLTISLQTRLDHLRNVYIRLIDLRLFGFLRRQFLSVLSNLSTSRRRSLPSRSSSSAGGMELIDGLTRAFGMRS